MKIYKEVEDLNFPVFARKEFLMSRSDEYGWLAMKNHYLPYVIDKKLIFRRLIFTNSIFAADGDCTIDTREFLDKAVELIKLELKVDFIAKAQGNVVFEKSPTQSISAPWGTYLKTISGDKEDMMKSFGSKTRNMIRRGVKEGLEVESGTVKDLHQMLEMTFERQKESLLCPSLAYLEKLKENLKNQFLILKCSKKDELQCVVGVPFDRSTGFYLYGGSVARPIPGSMNLLQYETMLTLGKKGVKRYDFVGARINVDKTSKYNGIQKFKTSFNPELIIGKSFKVIFNKPKYWLFQFSVKMAYMLKGGKYHGDPIDQIRKEDRK